MHKQLSCAIIGCGTVGGSVARLLIADRQSLFERSGFDINLKYIVSRNQQRSKDHNLPRELFEPDLQKALNDPDIALVVELVGGMDFAKDCIIRALSAGKHVVTANKALLASHGPELYALARSRGLCLAFEASCGGGIPIIRSLIDGLAANTIDAIFGVVNGTCNYILTEMISKGQTFQQALSQAQGDGLAEAEPSLDIDGSDSAHKIAIMAALAFGKKIDIEQIPVTGIDQLQSVDLNFGMEMGYRVKLIASAVNTKQGIFLRVEPAFIADNHPLAWVAGSFNAISVYGHNVGHTMYYGRGAGGQPTASAVIADIIAIANGSYPALFNSLQTWPDLRNPAHQIRPEEMQRRYYIRLQLRDRTGILAKITSILSRHSISLSSVLQHEAEEPASPGESTSAGTNNPADISAEESASTNPQSKPCIPLVITTHQAREKEVMNAVSEILDIDDVLNEHSIVPILDEHPEFYNS